MAGTTSISDLMYVDDILLFSKKNPKSRHAIKTILEQFTTFVGLEVDAKKRSITLSKVCEDMTTLNKILGFLISKLPIQYLGPPITEIKKTYNQSSFYMRSARQSCGLAHVSDRLHALDGLGGSS